MVKKTAFLLSMLSLAGALWAQELPRAISSYYDDWNFVARNSTPHQRAAVWGAYRRSETAVLSGTDQELLVRMKRIVDATVRSSHSMPMLLAGTQSPVSPELLVQVGHTVAGNGEILVLLKAVQFPSFEAARGSKSLLRLLRKQGLVSMCQYTDRWKQQGGAWKVARSLAVWVDAH